MLACAMICGKTGVRSLLFRAGEEYSPVLWVRCVSFFLKHMIRKGVYILHIKYQWGSHRECCRFEQTRQGAPLTNGHGVNSSLIKYVHLGEKKMYL